MRRNLLIGLGVVALVAVAIQLVPYGRGHANPQVIAEPDWSSPEARDLAALACFDCHSNETIWPWYSKVAPISWLVQWDVDRGRQELNLSEWNRPQEEAGEAAQVLREGEMPQWYYKLLHPEAKLTSEEAARLAREFQVILVQK